MDRNEPGNAMEAPGARRLLRSTAIAAAAAAALLVGVVLPAEYGIDPLGLGDVLGLTEMGEIKVQLAKEAEADAAPQSRGPSSVPTTVDAQRLDAIEARLEEIYALLAWSQPAATQRPQADAALWRDEVSIVLTPGQGVEYKLVMEEGAKAAFEWTANGGALNFDTHGDAPGTSISYEKGRGAPADKGSLIAAFTGSHGWFFRNRMDADVKLTLRTRGDYSELKRTG